MSTKTDATFIATEDLYIGWACAHRAGDEVPAANVEAHGWLDKVARQGTKAAEKATDSGG